MDKKILFLGLDAAMPDLVKKFVAEGVMPNTANLMNQGVFSRLETVFPCSGLCGAKQISPHCFCQPGMQTPTACLGWVSARMIT